MTDIVDKLSGKIGSLGTRNLEDYNTWLPSTVVVEAIREIERLRSALRKIGFDYVELSHDKVQYLYLEHMQIARDAYQKSFPLDTDKPSDSPLDDNF